MVSIQKLGWLAPGSICCHLFGHCCCNFLDFHMPNILWSIVGYYILTLGCNSPRYLINSTRASICFNSPKLALYLLELIPKANDLASTLCSYSCTLLSYICVLSCIKYVILVILFLTCWIHLGLPLYLSLCLIGVERVYEAAMNLSYMVFFF